MGDVRSKRPPLRGIPGLVALAALTAACGSGLTNTQWAWCKLNLAAVDAAAEGVGLQRVQTSVKDPSWWPDYITSQLNSSLVPITENTDFLASCDAAADEKGVGASRVNWCLADGLAETWGKAVDLKLTTESVEETFAYRALPLLQRYDNPDFDKACVAAYSARNNQPS
jgi:hypothetical protein